MVYSNLFINSEVDFEIDGKAVSLQLEADYPTSGHIEYKMSMAQPTEFTFAVRKPEYVKKPVLKVNGEIQEILLKDGYYYIKREWKDGDQVEAEYDVEFRMLRCNPRVHDNIGKLALVKGPVVYCLEEADNGKYLNSILVKADTEIEEVFENSLLGGTLCASFKAKRIDYDSISEELYTESAPFYKEDTFTAVPYCYWNNRGKGEMLVWMREDVQA